MPGGWALHVYQPAVGGRALVAVTNDAGHSWLVICEGSCDSSGTLGVRATETSGRVPACEQGAPDLVFRFFFPKA